MLLAKADRLVAALRDHGLAHRDTIQVGRTHGVHAEPDVWGHRVADFAFAHGPRRGTGCAEPARRVGVVAISGAVGTYSQHRPGGRGARRRARSACARPTPPPRWCCATGSASGSPRWRSSRPSARRSRWRCGTASAPRCASCRSRSARARRAPRAMPHKKNPIMSERICRPGPGRAGADRAGHGGHPALARARHLALVGRAGRAARRRDRHRLPAAPDGRLVSGPGRRRRPDAGQPGLHRRADLHLVGAAGAGRGRAVPRGRLRPGAGRGDGDLAGRHARSARRCARRPPRPAQTLDEARLDEICRPERYVARLGPLFDRLEKLT